MKPKKHFATRGWLMAEGATKTEAKAKLETMIDWALGATGTLTIESRFGLVVIVAADANGFCHAVFDPAELEHGKQRYGLCCHGQVDRSEALQRARSHAAQNAWSPAVNDDSGFVNKAGLDARGAGELAHWIRWQRSYRDFRAAGKTDCEAHALATGYQLVA